NNTVYKVGRQAFYAPNAFQMTIKNNAFYGKVLIYDNIRILLPTTTQGPHTIDYNAYWDDSTYHNRVGEWGTSVLNFANWKAACRCDSHSRNVDPKFVNLTPGKEDFHLHSSSPLIDAGSAGVNIGAYP